jgi:hypothetical protein
MSVGVCVSIHHHVGVTDPEELNRFALKFILCSFTEMYGGITIVVEIEQNNGYFTQSSTCVSASISSVAH